MALQVVEQDIVKTQKAIERADSQTPEWQLRCWNEQLTALLVQKNLLLEAQARNDRLLVQGLLREPVGQLQTVATDMAASCTSRQQLAASNICDQHLCQIRQVLKALYAPWPDDPVINELLLREPGDWEGHWSDDDERTEDRQRVKALDAVKATIAQVLGISSWDEPRGQPQQIAWFDARRMALKHRFPRLEFDVSSKNGDVLGVTSFGPEAAAAGALLGILPKKKLTWQGARQAETEFYIWQYSSQVPFCQVITDFTTGGIAYHRDGPAKGGGFLLRYRVFTGMEHLCNFMAEFISSSLPSDLMEQLKSRRAADPNMLAT